MTGNWRGRRVVVTGAGGFIASHLVERLVAEGAHVVAVVRYTSTGTAGWLDRSPVRGDLEVVATDICDTGLVGRALVGSDTVFHLAALIGIPYSYAAPSSYVQVNVGGTSTVLDAARAAGVRRVVHTSTSEVYGTARTVPMSEEHPLQPQSPYAATKSAADLLALSYHRSFGLPVSVVRPFNTYGPRQSARAVIPTIISQALSGDAIRLGDVTPTRDFTFVADTVEGFLAVASHDDSIGTVTNLGSGGEVSIGDVARRIIALTGTTAQVVQDADRTRPAASEVRRLWADITRARALGWAPRHDLDAGLQQTIDWIREHLAHFTPGRYAI